MGVLLRNLSKGGSFLDNVVATIESARFEMFDFRGKARDGAVPAAHLVINADGEMRDEYYTVGKASLWTINADGSEIDGPEAVTGRSKLGILMSSILDALGAQGMNSDWITDKITCLEGLTAHWVQVPSGGKGEDGVEKTIPVPDEIVSLPGGEKPGQADLEQATAAAIESILKKKGGRTNKSSLVSLVLVEASKDPRKNEMSKLAQNDAFLKANFAVEGTFVKAKV